jgi:hypothetical protein
MGVTSKKIEELRQTLQKAAKDINYNFLNPDLLRISQKLDQLIVGHMRQGSKKPLNRT